MPRGIAVPVTVLEAGPCVVLGLRTVEKDGYSAARLAFGAVKEKRVTKPVAGEFKKAGARRSAASWVPAARRRGCRGGCGDPR